MIGELTESNNMKKAKLFQIGMYFRDGLSAQPTRHADIPTGLSYWHEWLPQVGLSG